MSQSLRNPRKMIGLRRSEDTSGGDSSKSVGSEDLFSELAGEGLSIADLEEFREFMASAATLFEIPNYVFFCKPCFS